MTLLHKAKGRGISASDHLQHRGCDSFDCCAKKYKIAVLLSNSELTVSARHVTQTQLKKCSQGNSSLQSDRTSRDGKDDGQKCLITLHIVDWVIT